MTPRALARLLGGYAAAMVVVAVIVHFAVALRRVDGAHVRTAWRKGEVVARSADGPIAEAPGVTVVDEHVVGEAPILTTFEPLFAVSLVAGVDGVSATLNGKTVYLTPDELLARQAYDKGITIPSLSLSLGADIPLVEALLGERLGVSAPVLREKATLRRVRVERPASLASLGSAKTTPADVTPASLREAALAAASFLARGVGQDGRFRYMVDAPTDRTLPGYDWPRHAGATYFLAQAAELTKDPVVAGAALRAAKYLREKSTQDCGGLKCVGPDAVIEIGSASLGVIALAEIARVGLDASARDEVVALSTFLRAQQRPDGEFMHFFDRRTGKPIDAQTLYYSGEATLALARAYELTGDEADLEASRRGLSHLVGPAWRFFGNRYYFGEEHWTCQAMADLWERAPDPDALDFCARWRAYDANMMYGPDDLAIDADGSFGVGPVVTPRLTPVGSRSEAGVATLDALIRSNADPARRDALASQLRRSFALLMRQQLRPGRAYLFANAADVAGALPGSDVDWQLRIDYAQHAGSAMIRAAALWSRGAAASP